MKLRESHLWPAPEKVETLRAFCADLWARKRVWLGRTGRESHTRQELLDPILKRLGFGFLSGTDLPSSTRRREPDYLLYSDEETKLRVFASDSPDPYPPAIALVEAKKVNHPLDRVSKHDTPGRFPHQQVRDYLQYATDSTGKPFFNWAILTNGNLWRLYCRNATPDDYFEFNFEKALDSPEDFAVFVALFSPRAFVVDSEGRCPLDELRDDALRYQTRLEDDLRGRVFNILEDLANGFYSRSENSISQDQLPDLYQNCLILLYRLLFVLYAEGRGLLPVRPYGAGSNRTYRERFSLQRLLPSLRDPARFYDDDALTRLYEDLRDLFRLINGDQPSLNRKCDVPQYNGGLFDSKAHPKLNMWRVGEKTLADALRGLMYGRIPARRGQAMRIEFGETIDYAELEVRQLGSIYEGLLENHLELRDGRLVLVGDKAERKATGTYYTPDFIVRYIVDHTLGPLCQRIHDSEAVQKAIGQGKRDNSFADAVLQLKILDPAMGSGHFLVRATEYLAEKILDHPTTAIPVSAVSPGLSQAAAVRAYWRRRVVERCIFGVDLNPLAVELAKLSLWLTCIATDQPLSFLDHHLRPGNSLVGAKLSELGSLPSKKTTTQYEMWTAPDLRAAVSQALAALALIEETESKDIRALKEKEAKWSGDVLPKLEPYRKVADLWVATCFGLRLDPALYARLAEALVNGKKPRSKADRQTAELLRKHMATVSDLRRTCPFFHWELEFPEVFFNADGTPKTDAGFDAVIGNPPYGGSLSAAERSFAERAYDLGTTDTAALMMARAHSLTAPAGYTGMIVPKSWTYSSTWQRTREETLPDLLELANVGRAWKDVRLEQVVYVRQTNSATKSYQLTARRGTAFRSLAEVGKSDCRRFGFLLNGVDQGELAVGLKVLKAGVSLGTLVTNVRGAMVQRFVCDEHDGHPVLGGKQIQRYCIVGVKGFIPAGAVLPAAAFAAPGSILAQNIVAHIENPFDHISIACTLADPPEGRRVVILDTVNQLANRSPLSSKYILGVLCSRLANWYVYRFVYARAIRTMHFDCPATDRIPIRTVNLAHRVGRGRHDKMVGLVERMLTLHRALHAAWAESEKDAIRREIAETDRQIDALVYELYGLTDEEIAIVEGRTAEASG